MKQKKQTEITEIDFFCNSIEYWLKYEIGILKACKAMKLDLSNYIKSRLYVSKPDDKNHEKVLRFLLERVKDIEKFDDESDTDFLLGGVL